MEWTQRYLRLVKYLLSDKKKIINSPRRPPSPCPYSAAQDYGSILTLSGKIFISFNNITLCLEGESLIILDQVLLSSQEPFEKKLSGRRLSDLT